MLRQLTQRHIDADLAAVQEALLDLDSMEMLAEAVAAAAAALVAASAGQVERIG
jgi:hypothetical protein